MWCLQVLALTDQSVRYFDVPDRFVHKRNDLLELAYTHLQSLRNLNNLVKRIRDDGAGSESSDDIAPAGVSTETPVDMTDDETNTQ